MVKKLLTMTMGLLLVIGASAQTAPESVNIAESDVEFWVGTGSNSSLVCIGWDHASAPYTPTVVVWGIHWNGNITLQDALDSVTAYDSRFTYTVSNNYVSNLDYNDPDNNIHLSPYLNWNCNNYNGVYSFTYLTSSWLRISESTCDNYNFTNVNNLIYASDPNATNDPVDASIDFSDILYWVGEGSDSAALIVNFGIPDTAFAWGYRFNGTATVQQMTDAITAADPRFTVVGLPSMYPEGDIFFVLTSGDTLSLSGRNAENPWNYWEAGINGEVSYTGASQTLVNGDVFKYGDQRAPSRICVEEMDYGGTVYCLHAVWTKAPTPVTVPDTTTLPVDATIAASDILYWVGEGSDSAIFVISDGVNTRAWGYLFDEDDEPTAIDMASDIAEADPRLVYTVTDWTTFGMGFIYREFPTTISIADTRFKVDGVLADDGDMLSDYDLLNGTVVVISSDTAATWTTPIVPATVKHMPVNSTIDPEDILYWVGEGVNEAVVVVNWGVPDTALAWGLRFTNATSIGDAIDAIAAADPRVTTDAAHSTINYTEGNVNLSFQPAPASYMQFILGDNSNVNVTTLLDNGDQLKIGESAYGTGYDSIDYMGMWYPMGVVWNTTIHPVSVPDTTTPGPILVDATIAFDDILWWIGEGSDSAALIVNFAQPDTAFAWGVLFNGSTNGETMLNAVVAADSNLSISGNPDWGDGQIYYTLSDGTVLSRRGTQWKFNINGVDSWGDEDIHNGDVFKFGDPVSGEQVGTFQYNWYKVPTPVAPQIIDTTTPEPQPTSFCGAVGTEGCNAIAQDSNCIVAWATAVQLTRGPQNITNPNGPLASFGGDTNAIGPATPSNTTDAVSLGDGGSALVTFAHPIRNGVGPDFAVFENGFGDFFLELAFVEVSSDGHRFVRFPATSLTQTETQTGGMGSTDPTKINNLAGKFRIGWGTPFDLEDLRDSTGIDIDSIVYVRIVDVVGSINPQYATYDAYGHIVNDPWPTNFESSGFDLTGVAVMYERIDSIPVTPMPDEATIATSDILYWVGEGSNEVVMAVNWADTALAWGYRFNGTKSVGDMMNDIAAADPRFSIELGDYSLNDILFVIAPGDTLRKQAGSWWESKNNGITDAGMAQTLNNGDFEKWAEPAAGVVVDSMYYDGWGWSYVYVYPMEIHPVSAPTAGIAEVVTSIESLWPNPTTDHVNVTASRAVTATLFDCTGRELHTYSLQQGTNVINLTAIPAGVYFLRADGATARVIKR